MTEFTLELCHDLRRKTGTKTLFLKLPNWWNTQEKVADCKTRAVDYLIYSQNVTKIVPSVFYSMAITWNPILVLPPRVSGSKSSLRVVHNILLSLDPRVLVASTSSSGRVPCIFREQTLFCPREHPPSHMSTRLQFRISRMLARGQSVVRGQYSSFLRFSPRVMLVRNVML